jgi:DNA-binding LacI/PurR family transcriptional regulator
LHFSNGKFSCRLNGLHSSLMWMSKLIVQSIPEQIASYLRNEINLGRWGGIMPGRNELAKELEVGISSVQQALRLLQEEGVLVTQGVGQVRRIRELNPSNEKRGLRIAILAYEKSTMSKGIFSEVAHVLQESGHEVFFAKSTLLDLKMSASRVAKLVNKTEADAWVLCSAAKEITQWFASQAKPAFALFGRRRGLPLASVGPDTIPAIMSATRRLIECGHQRIVMLVRPDRRKPVPAAPERAFLAELEAKGITPGSYHLPDWDDGVEGFQMRLSSLFHVQPPTALIVDELMLFIATQQFLSKMRLRVPEDVSLVSMESNLAFSWCIPTIAHLHYDSSPVLRRIVEWASNIAFGKIDLRETLIRAEFIDGGTIGPVNH